MKNMKKLEKYCSGCGIKLQNENETKLGFVKDLNHELCLSCFRLKHYNISTDEVLKTHFPEVPNGTSIVYIVSILHLNTLYKYDLTKFYPNSKIIVLINFIDLLPKTVNFDLWVKKLKKDNILEVMPISALKGTYVDLFLETLDYYNLGDIYFIGLQNSGKSTLLNRISKHLELDIEILTSTKPGLTLENIKIPYKKNYLIDTPGVYEKGFISDYLVYDEYKNIVPNKPFKPITFQITEPMSFIIGGVAIISIIKGYPLSVTFYLKANIHRTKYENSLELLNKHKDALFSPFINEPFYKTHLKIEEESLINIYDLGFLVVSQATLEILAPKDANIKAKKGSYHGL